MVMMTKEKSIKIVNFTTLEAGVLVIGRGLISHTVKIHYTLKNLLLYSHTLIKQSDYKVMRTKKGSTNILNFLTPGVGVLVLGRGHISHRQNALFL